MLFQYPIVVKPGQLNNPVDDIFLISPKEASGHKYAIKEFPLVTITARKGIIHYPNDHFCKISKYNRELTGQDPCTIHSGYHLKSKPHASQLD
jgi:hypothetical protein